MPGKNYFRVKFYKKLIWEKILNVHKRKSFFHVKFLKKFTLQETITKYLNTNEFTLQKNHFHVKIVQKYLYRNTN